MRSGVSLLLRLFLLLPALLTGIFALALWLHGDSLVLSLVDRLLVSEQLTLHRGYLRVDLLGGSISGEDLALVETGSGRPIVTVGQLRARLQLLDLLKADNRQTSLAASQVSVSIYAVDDSPGSPEEQVGSLSFRNWLPGMVDIDQVRVNWEGTAPRPSVLFTHVQGSAGRRDGSYELASNLQYGDTKLIAQATLQSLKYSGDDLYGLDMSADLQSHGKGGRLRWSGRLVEEVKGLRYQGNANLEFEDVTHLLDMLALDYPVNGALGIAAVVEGDFDGLGLRDVIFSLDNAPVFTVTGTGEIDYAFDGSNRLDLALQTELQDLHRLADVLPIDLGEFGSAGAAMRLQGAFDDVMVRDIELQVHNVSGLDIGVVGEIRINHFSADQLLTGDGLDLTASAPSLSALRPWTGELSMETGPWQARGTLLQAENSLRVRDLEIMADDGAGFSIAARGEIDRLGNLESGDDWTLEGFNFWLELASASSQRLSAPFVADLPELGSVFGRVRVQGNRDLLAFRDLQASMVKTGIFRATGVNGRFDLLPGQNAPVRDLRLDLEVEVLSSEPQAGAAGGLSAALSVAGVAPLDDLRLDATLNNLSTNRLLQLYGVESDYQVENDALNGDFTLLGSGDSFGLRDIDIRNEQSEDFSFSVHGSINNLADLRAIDLRAEVAIADREFLRQISGLRLSPWRASLQVVGSDDYVTVGSTNRFGDTEIDARLRLDVDQGGLAAVAGKLSTPALHLQDIGLANIADRKNEGGQDTKGSPSEGASGFLLQELPGLPIGLELSAGRIDGESFEARALHVDVFAAEGLYTLRRFEVDHTGGKTRASGMLDTRNEPALWALKGSSLDLQIDGLMRDLGISSDVTGRFNTAIDLQARGDTAEALIGSLDGDVTLVLEDVTIKGAAYDVLATQTVAWFYSGAALEDKTVFTCVIGDFGVERGRAHTDEFFVESDRMLALGPLTLDFKEMTVNAEISPRSKKRALQVPGKIKVTGPFDKLVVSSPALAHGADATTEVATFIPRFALKTFDVTTGMFVGRKKEAGKAVTRCQQIATP